MPPVLDSFVASLISLYPPLLLVAAGLVLARLGILTVEANRTLAAVTTNFALPAMAVHKFLTGFSPAAVEGWYWLPLAAWAIVGIGTLVALPVGRLVARPRLREFVAVGSLNNAGYVPLAMAMCLFPDPEQVDRFQMLIMIYVLGVSPVLWSMGVRLIGRSQRVDRLHKALLNPMFITVLACLLLCLTGANAPFLSYAGADGATHPGAWAWVLTPAKLAGAATIPMAMLVLGASLAHVPRGTRLAWPSMLAAAGVRLVAVPAIVVTAMLLLPLPKEYHTLRYLICLESCTPPAAALAVQARRFDGDADWVGHHLAACYVAAVLTVPVVLTILKLAA